MKKLLLFQILIFFLSSCIEKPPVINDISGVVITFDDKYINDWYSADSILQHYDWKATFFVAKNYLLTDNQIQKLKLLLIEGHEIGGHGFHHVHTSEYIQQYGLQKFMINEILPMIHVFDSLNFTVTDFAYPYGESTHSSDSALLSYFNIVRKLDWFNNTASKQKCYFDNNRIIYAYPLDSNYNGTDWPYIKSLLQFAKDSNKIVILYSHDIVNQISADYQVNLNKLENICSFVQQNQMKFYTTKELYNLILRNEQK